MLNGLQGPLRTMAAMRKTKPDHERLWLSWWEFHGVKEPDDDDVATADGGEEHEEVEARFWEDWSPTDCLYQ